MVVSSEALAAVRISVQWKPERINKFSSLALKTDRESLIGIVCGSKFQTDGAENQGARLEKSICPRERLEGWQMNDMMFYRPWMSATVRRIFDIEHFVTSRFRYIWMSLPQRRRVNLLRDFVFTQPVVHRFNTPGRRPATWRKDVARVTLDVARPRLQQQKTST